MACILPTDCRPIPPRRLGPCTPIPEANRVDIYWVYRPKIEHEKSWRVMACLSPPTRSRGCTPCKFDGSPLWRSDQTLQALNSRTYGHYALSFLKERAQGRMMENVFQQFALHHLVGKGRYVGEQVRRWIVEDVEIGAENQHASRQCSFKKIVFACVRVCVR